MMFDDRVGIQIAIAESWATLDTFASDQGNLYSIKSLIQIPVLQITGYAA